VTTERLWTPWRMAYIRQGADEDGSNRGCIFCDLLRENDDQRTHILARGSLTFVILNAFPYNPGHLMVAPYRHVGDYVDLTPDELAETMAFTGTAVRALQESSGAHGFNLGMNLGGVAGAGITDHLHMHLVPRWGGDTNFMPVVSQTKVLPELLSETWERLRPWFADEGRPAGAGLGHGEVHGVDSERRDARAVAGGGGTTADERR
jgi:ATP adenylyltransferase